MGTDPWNGVGLELTTSTIKFKGTDVSLSNHNHTSVYTGMEAYQFNNRNCNDYGTWWGAGHTSNNQANRTADWYSIYNFSQSSNKFQLAAYTGVESLLWFRTTHDQTNSFNNWRQIWHTGNFDPNSKAASNHNHDNYKYLQYTNRFHSDNSVTVDNFRCGHTFNYTTGGSPVTGPLLSFGGLASNYDCQITSNYTNGADLYTRTHNGDTGIWSAWHRIWTFGNFNPEHPGSTLSIGGNSLYIYLQDQDIWGSKWCSLDMGRNVPLGNLQAQNYYGASDRNLKNDIEYLDDKNKGAISKKRSI